jgi:hypothetical protein
LRRQSTTWLIVPILLLSIALGIRGLDSKAMWVDELYSIRDAGGGSYGSHTLAEIWSQVQTNNNDHTPGYFMLLSAWEHLAGDEPPVLRILSFFAGLLTVALVYRIGADIVSVRAGLNAAALLATSAFFVHYTYELRMYTLVAFFTALTLWIYLYIIRLKREPGITAWVGLFISTFCLLYLHYFAALTAVTIGIYHLLFVPKNKRWLQVVLAMLPAGLLFLPWLVPVLGSRTSSGLRHRYAFLPHELALQLAYFFSSGLTPLMLVTVGAALLARQRGARMILLLTIILFAVMSAANLVTGIVANGLLRYVLGIWPLLALVAGAGLARLQSLLEYRNLPAASVPVLVVLWMAIGVWNNVTGIIPSDAIGADPWFPMHTVSRTVRALGQTNDAVVTYLPDGESNWRYRTSRLLADFYFDDMWVKSMLTTTRFYIGQDADEAMARQNLARDRQRVWVAYDPGGVSSSQPAFESWLRDDQGYNQCPVAVDTPSVRVDQYTLSPICCMSEHTGDTVRFRFANGIALVDAEPLPETARDSISLAMLWSVPDQLPPNDFSLTLHLEDENGNKVGQLDTALLSMRFACQRVSIPLDNLPPGEYRLFTGVYPWRTGARMNGTDTATGQISDLLPLGTFRITNQ